MNRRLFLQSILASQAWPIASGSPAMPSISYRCRLQSMDVLEGSRIVQRVASAHPLSPVLHPSGKFLFVVNCVDSFDGLPTGSVESFSVELNSGRLQPLSRRALSLSSTHPTSCAVSPDGDYLAVAAYTGGTYSVLSIGQDGRLGPVTHVRKEIGTGPHPVLQRTAHPCALAFHPTGHFLIGADSGSDCLSVFRLQAGTLTRIAQRSSLPGSGPAQLHFDPARSLLSVEHRFKPLLTRYYLDPQTGALYD